jgi:hypothetical protein
MPRGGPVLILRGAAVAACFGLAVLASSLHGVPQQLPGVALDWRLLFHVERASALLATSGAILLVAWRGTRGEFPVKFGQLEYAVKDAAAFAAEVDESHEKRLQTLELLSGLRDEVDPDLTT